MVTVLLISIVIFFAWTKIGWAQDVRAGEAAFRKCQICHDVGETARNMVGPPLNGLDGRRAGSITGYDYSEATKVPESPGAKLPSKNISKIHQREFREQKCSFQIRTKRRSRTYGLI
jgi:cytochrome c2